MPRASAPVLGYTLDTGVLSALERRKREVAEILRQAALAGSTLRIPHAVVAEFWRGTPRKELVALVERFAVSETLRHAQRAGISLGKIGRGPSVVDAIVAAVADEHGDVVLTADREDLTLLRNAFPRLRIRVI